MRQASRYSIGGIPTVRVKRSKKVERESAALFASWATVHERASCAWGSRRLQSHADGHGARFVERPAGERAVLRNVQPCNAKPTSVSDKRKTRRNSSAHLDRSSARTARRSPTFLRGVDLVGQQRLTGVVLLLSRPCHVTDARLIDKFRGQRLLELDAELPNPVCLADQVTLA